MSDATEQRTQVLPADAERVLDEHECYSVQVGNSSTAAIYNCDGDHEFTVSLAITAFDLRAMFAYGSRLYDRGCANGRRGMQEALRNLINAAPLEPTR